VSIPRWLAKHNRLSVPIYWFVLICLWEAAYRLFGWRPWVFPAPSHVLDSICNLLGITTYFGDALHAGWPMKSAAGDAAHDASTLRSFFGSHLVLALLTSAYRLAIGFVISMALGLAIGLAMWRYRTVDAMLGPLFLGLQTLPSICWVPFAILTLGISESGILFVLVMGSFFAIAISLRDGLNTTPPIYRAAGLVFGARRWNFYRYVMLPAGLPALTSSLRSGFSFAWRSLMGGELVFVLKREGVGHLLSTGREFGDIAQVVAVMMIMVMIGMAADRLAFARIERRIRTRFGLSQH
jgi:NitT/TauT family transport system permease protein